MMTMRTVRGLALGTLSIFALAGFTHAATLTLPTDRTAKLILLSIRNDLATMRPSAGVSPAAMPRAKASGIRVMGMAQSGIPSGVPMAPMSSEVASDQLVRFLQLGITQSYNKTFEQGWNILHTNVQQSLTAFGPLPTGIRLALTSGRDASYKRSYETAYKVLLLAMKTVATSPGDLAGDPRSAFSAYMRLARTSSYEKTHEEGWNILSKYITNLQTQGAELIPTNELRLAVKATIESSYTLAYQAAYEAVEAGIKVMENVPGGPLASFYFAQAVQASNNKSYEQGYKILRAYIDNAINSGYLQPYEKLALETSRQSSYGKAYQAAYEIIRDGLNSLVQ